MTTDPQPDPVRTAVITLCSSPRLRHLRNQLAALSAHPDALRVVVWVGDDAPPPLEADVVLRMPPGPEGLRLSAARNAGAAAARRYGTELLVFLDADCVPGDGLLPGYLRAADRHPTAVLCGPVTYLAEDVDIADHHLAELTAPHPARPTPPDETTRVAEASEYPLFWSLSFAMTASTWVSTGGFDERYEGYGGEDTDFAFRLRDRGIPLVWVGGAHAYHQYHPTQSPPWQHLDDILRNGARFAAQWGQWPMTGWLERFRDAGAVIEDVHGWRRT
jgi:N-acetylglucosaminyl-diphospho-decaprenol L-rhamnosyltransferase